MPQLDTIYTLMTLVWVWTTLYILVQKIKTLPMTKTPKHPPQTPNQHPTPTLPWT